MFQFKVLHLFTRVSCFNPEWNTLFDSDDVPPFTYLWSGPNGYSSIFEDIVGLIDGFYQVNILDYNNCLFNNIFNITNPSLLDTSSVIKNNISCNGGNNGSIILDVTGGTPSYNYSWSNGDTSYQTTNVSVGIYNVTITDANGCNFPILYFTLHLPGRWVTMNGSFHFETLIWSPLHFSNVDKQYF